MCWPRGNPGLTRGFMHEEGWILQLHNLDSKTDYYTPIAYRCGPLQAMMQHCWPSSGPDKMDVRLKWPTCEMANRVLISPNVGLFW